jgi:hypothetical protein
MKMTQATQGYLFTLRAEGYSQATIDLYNYMLTTLAGFLNDPEVHTVQVAPFKIIGRVSGHSSSGPAMSCR